MDISDNAKDEYIIDYLNKIKIIKEMKTDKNYELVTTLACETIVNSNFNKKVIDKNFSNVLGKKIYEYIIEYPNDNLIPKVCTELRKSNISEFDQHITIKTYCYIFKLK